MGDDRYADWDEIYLDNVVRLYRLMYSKVGNRPDAEDLTTEVFLAALRPLRATASRGEVRAYLAATARTVLASYWRTRLGAEATVIEVAAALRFLEDPPSESQAAGHAHRLLDELPDRYRQILELRFLNGTQHQGGGAPTRSKCGQRQGAPASSLAHGRQVRARIADMRHRRRKVEQGLQAIADGERLPAGRLEDSDDLEALRVAIDLRAGRVAADLPSDEFVAALHRQLVNEREPSTPSRNISRRALFAGAGAAAAAAAVGVVADRTLLSGRDAGPTNVAAELAPNDGQWVAVNSVATNQPTAQRFDTPTVVGFVSGQGDNLVAVSGACTHLGCLLQPNPQAGRLDCPCHRTSFGYDGRVLFSQLDVPPAPLPRIGVRQRNGTVEVLVPRQT